MRCTLSRHQQQLFKLSRPTKKCFLTFSWYFSIIQDKRKINEVLDKLNKKTIEELYNVLLKNDKAKKKCNMGYNKTNKIKRIVTKKNKTRKILLKK